MDIKSSHIVLDSCCILNICASEHLIEIIQAIPTQLIVAQVVRDKELITLRRLTEEADQNIDSFEAAIAKGLIMIEDFSSEQEEETFIDYVFELGDDGESASGAIAVNRQWAIATDDKRAISFFQREVPQLEILSTLDIIKHWSETDKVSVAKLRSVLTAVRTRGRYIPPRNHPLIRWWEEAMR